MKDIIIPSALFLVACIIFGSCTSIPRGAVAVKPFDTKRYLGKWYEIARLDFRFERNLDNTTARYSMNSDGTIKVDNRGFNTVTGKWEQAVGKAKQAGNPGEAKLKVSFFGPFFSPYNVIALDSEYQVALVAGKNLKYLWILARQTTIPEETRQNYLKIARDLGYDINALIWVKHDKSQEEDNLP